MTYAASSQSVWDQHLEESIGIRPEAESSNLLPAFSANQVDTLNATIIPVNQIIADPQQPRTQFDEASLKRLAQSIQRKGQLSPIRVRWSEERRCWIIISGERRWRACQLAGLTTIHCCIQTGEQTSSHIREEQLVENLLREELNPIDEARAFQTLIEINQWTNKQLAEALSIPASKVTRTLALLKLSHAVQSKITTGEIPARTAYEISRLPSEAARESVAQQAVAEKWTLAKTKRSMANREHKRQSRQAPQLTFYVEGEWRVVVIGQRRGPYEEIEEVLLTALEEVRHRIRNRVRWD